MQRYLFITEYDVCPMTKGPFKSEGGRTKAARRYKKGHGDRDGIFVLNVYPNGRVETYAYSGRFFEK